MRTPAPTALSHRTTVPLRALACTVALAGCAAGAHRAGPTHAHTAPPAGPVPLVVTLVVDQLAAWIADERVPALPPDGGFARLRREGLWLRHMRYLHAATDTAPGHASLYTGVSPREHGVFANELPDAIDRRSTVLADARARAVTLEGTADGTSSSAARLRVRTIADALREAHPRAVIVSLSLKDRGAIAGGGRTPDATLWFDPGRDAFVTSTAFATQVPAWARTLMAPDAQRAQRAAPWTLLDPAFVASHARTPDAQPGEGDLYGFGTVFPHEYTRSSRAPTAFRASPAGDRALLSLALEAVRAARRPGEPMLLAVSLSSHDYVNHIFGPDSWESWDELLRLDRELGAFFRALDALVGPSQWAALLSADHGSAPLPETSAVSGARPWCNGAHTENPGDPYERPCDAGVRLSCADVGRALERVAEQAVGRGSWVRGVADPFVFLTDEARALPAERSRALRAALRAHLASLAGVRAVYDTQEFTSGCAPAHDEHDESERALVCRSIPQPAEGALYVVSQRGSFFDSDYVSGFGMSHGTPFLYDRTVPLFVRAPSHVRGDRAVDEPARFDLYAYTAARLLGLAWPEAAEHARVFAP